MRVEKTPITVYDFFGYFILGFIFLSLMFYTFEENFVATILKKITDTSTLADDILLGVFFTFFSYIVGHILSYISHFCIEILVKKKFYKQKTGCDFCSCIFFR